MAVPCSHCGHRPISIKSLRDKLLKWAGKEPSSSLNPNISRADIEAIFDYVVDLRTKLKMKDRE